MEKTLVSHEETKEQQQITAVGTYLSVEQLQLNIAVHLDAAASATFALHRRFEQVCGNGLRVLVSTVADFLLNDHA